MEKTWISSNIFLRNKKFYINISIMLFIFLFTGCFGEKQYGISVPEKEVALNNSKTKFYIDKNATYKYEKLLLNELKNDLAKGITVIKPYTPLLKKDILPLKKKSYSFIYYKKTNVLLPNSYNFLESIPSIGRIKNIKIKLSSHVQKHSLVIDKIYNNKKDVITDYMAIAKYLISNKKFIENYGYTSFYLDGNALKDNKLVIKSILPLVDFTPVL